MGYHGRSHKRKVPSGFGKRLEQAVFKSNLSTQDIERMSGVNHSNIYEYIDERMLPSAYNLYALCKTLKVSADYLLGLEVQDNE